jgi:hypothetical protein
MKMMTGEVHGCLLCLCSVERACSPCRLVEVSQLVPIVTDEMMMEIYITYPNRGGCKAV